jgi:RecB family endonuclease NucS
LARGCGKAFVIEVKRGVVDLNAVSQLKRYVDAVPNSTLLLPLRELLTHCFTPL